ncbi:FUSC family protein [Roseomonas terrae]|jgi:uncharacterized membrane protein YccC|uniref:FUSC family protein n=1 Tax=Neoroseomonas terrae TaxID=424799 RepID=A0ABS5ECP4_9PROT|nr:FUSC family protein [Neoroseomonas terrae]MBR0648779.1 FUSC family protein [Neoroseomonas terrae]
MRNFPFGVKSQDMRAALRVGVSVGLPLLVLYVIGLVHFAVYAAFGALTSLYGHTEDVRRRVETQILVGAALFLTIVAAALYSTMQGAEWLLSAMLAVTVIAAGTLGTIMGWVPRGEIFFILVLLVVAGVPLTLEALPTALAAGAAGIGFSILLTMVEPKGATDTPASGLRRRVQRGAESLDRTRHAIIITIAALAVTAAWLLASALGIGHPFWAPIAVAALMPALSPADGMRRAIHLLLGTFGGVCLAAILLAPQPGPLALIIMIAVCQAIAELFIARSYAVAMLFITPLAIGMSNLGRGLPWSPLLIERLMEAALGAAVALVAISIGSRLLASRTARHSAGEA